MAWSANEYDEAAEVKAFNVISRDIGAATRGLVKKASGVVRKRMCEAAEVRAFNVINCDIGAATRGLVKKARRAIAASAAAFAIAGCAGGAASAPPAHPLMVQVPVLHETPCPAPALANPALPIAALKPASAPADTMRAYAAAVVILKGAMRERDAVLAGCATQAHMEKTQ